MKTLSIRKLKLLGACEEQVKLFQELFGDSVEVTPELCATYAGQFDWDWAAQRLLSATANKAFDEAVASANKARDEAVAPANKAYDEAVAPANKARDEAVVTANKARDEAVVTANKARDEAVFTANKSLLEVKARAFVTAFLSSTPTQ